MRLFTALDLPPDTLLRVESLLACLRPEAQIKWSPLDNLHITIKFIGEWPEQHLNQLDAVLENLRHSEPLDVELHGLGWFPNARAPRVLWVGVHGGDALNSFAARTENMLLHLGIAPEAQRAQSRADQPIHEPSTQAATACPFCAGNPDAQRVQSRADQQIHEPAANLKPHPYLAHLTLARIKQPVSLQNLCHKVEQLKNTALGNFRAASFYLYRSDPGSNASIYRKIRTYRFEPAQSANQPS